MKLRRIYSALLTLILLACLSGVQGQYQGQYIAPSSGYATTGPSSAQNQMQYSQFYTVPSGPAPSSPIGVPQQFAIASGIPSTVYFGQQMQPMPYSQYQSNPTYTVANTLWIKGATDWTQYAVVPLGATVSLLAISPTGGSGSLISDGQIYSNSYALYLNSLLTFYAGTIGLHTLSFAINGQSSNQVTIDVTANSNYQPTNYNQGYYPYGYNSGYYPWSGFDSGLGGIVGSPSGDHSGDHKGK